ncbi:aldo/keto reductase [Heyndrickxia acidicola]|uniref:Aldo/keto reductase n=1 Tax=Heyndrickxia acidicola TaxID=209389 RepID=A0ABU6MLI4_9BACI|nr:aldo/keto reductase [Heyndrickxia acidicola]MED1205553.1 aldo/keto reductase [Heyndrickxia acidicola]
MTIQINNFTTLNNGVQMPWLGLGVGNLNKNDDVANLIKHAIRTGYHSIDTASFYNNEEQVGMAIRESGASRRELFITTKVWNTEQGYNSTLQAFEKSRKKLKLDYLDLYLVHWAVTGKYQETWKALEKLYKDGFVRAIGVCNFQIHHLQKIMENCEVLPMVNQVEFHPLLTQKDLLFFCKNNHIQLEAWSPLMEGNLNFPLLKELGEKHKKSPAQIVLRWDLQHGVVTIPRSSNPYRIEENYNIFDFQLTIEEMDRIDALNINKRFGDNPDDF